MTTEMNAMHACLCVCVCMRDCVCLCVSLPFGSNWLRVKRVVHTFHPPAKIKKQKCRIELESEQNTCSCVYTEQRHNTWLIKHQRGKEAAAWATEEETKSTWLWRLLLWLKETGVKQPSQINSRTLWSTVPAIFLACLFKFISKWTLYDYQLYKRGCSPDRQKQSRTI